MEPIKKFLIILFLSVIIIGIGWYMTPLFEFWGLKEVEGTNTKISNSDRDYNAFPKAIRINHTNVNYNDSILAVWYSGNSHVDSNSDGIIVGSLSLDNGDHWGEVFTIYDHPSLDCRNIGIACAPNGTIIIFFALVDAFGIDNKYEAWKDFGYIKSYDGGNTWSEFNSLINEPDFIATGLKTGNGYGDAVIVNGNEIYIMCYGYPVNTYDETHVSFLLKSNDNGESWNLVSELSLESGISTSEADFVNEEGLFFGFSRTQNTDERILYYYESDDNGLTWKNLNATNILGDCPDIFRLSDGRYIVAIRAYGKFNVYLGYFILPYNFRSLSESEKLSFIEKIEIKCMVRTSFRSSHGNVAYPSIVPLDLERILVVYYDIDAGGVFAKIIHEEYL